MGKAGSGKSTLFNKLCCTNFSSGSGQTGLTQNNFLKTSACGENSFTIIDTPGTDSSKETYKHAVQLRGALTAKPLNTIFLTLKYDSRFENLAKSYWAEISPVINQETKVVVLISHWDISKEKKNDFEAICNELKHENFSNIIFYSEMYDGSTIANLMFACMSNMNSEQIKISEEEFLLKFNISEHTATKEMFRSYQKSDGEAKKIEFELEKLIDDVKNIDLEDRDEFLHSLVAEFSNKLQSNVDLFRQKYKETMIDLDYYCFYIKMERDLVRRCDKFCNKINPLMSSFLFDGEDVRNMIKQCPNCGEIWFKTEGCDGETNCGAKVTKISDDLAKPCRKFLIFMNDCTKIFTWRKSDPSALTPRIATVPQQDLNNLLNKNVGCGAKFIWKTLPVLEENLILGLFKAKTIERANQLIKDMNFVNARKNFEKNVDTSFH